MDKEKSHIATQLEIARINLQTVQLKAANAGLAYMAVYEKLLLEKQACQRIVYALELAEDAE